MNQTEPPKHQESVLAVENLVVRYHVDRGVFGALARRPQEAVHAVEGVDFQLRQSEMLALVGESGSGKTTTAQAILRMVDADSGVIRFEGRDITQLNGRELRPLRKQMQMIYQDPYESLDPRFRVRATIEEPLRAHGIGGSKRERDSRVRDALARTGLTPPELYMDRFPHELSGGQRQRVAIAASLVLEPRLLLADEPVSMLDVSVRAGILRLLDSLRDDGLAILMITHDLSTAAHFADRIAVMYLGRIVEVGTSRDIISDPKHPYTQALLSVVPRSDPLDRHESQILSGETPDAMSIPVGCRFHPRCPAMIPACREIDPELRANDSKPTHRAACILA